MKYKDAHINMTVMDKFGNEYVIIALTNDEMPVKLKCTKFVAECIVGDTTKFLDCGDEWWIVDSEENYKEFTNYDVDISLESIKPKDKSNDQMINNTSFVDDFGNMFAITGYSETKSFILTCIKFVKPNLGFVQLGEALDVDKDVLNGLKLEMTSLADFPVGATVVDIIDNEYEVLANTMDIYDDQPVYLKCTKFVTNVSVDEYVDFAQEGDEWWIIARDIVFYNQNITYANNILCLDDFKLKV